MASRRRLIGLIFLLILLGSVAFPLGYLPFFNAGWSASRIWAVVSVAFTILYAATFYLCIFVWKLYRVQFWELLSGSRAFVVVTLTVLIVILGLSASVGLYFNVDYRLILLATFIMAVFFLINDKVVQKATVNPKQQNNINSQVLSLMESEFRQFLMFVDIPACFGFFLLLWFALFHPHANPGSEIEHFTHGAIAFQSIAFNITFSITLMTD